MKIFKTNLQGVLKIKLKPFKDLRGYYLETFNKNLFKRTKKKINFIQDDISVSKKNVLRGIHGDYKTWKLVSCLSGEFFFLVVGCVLYYLAPFCLLHFCVFESIRNYSRWQSCSNGKTSC